MRKEFMVVIECICMDQCTIAIEKTVIPQSRLCTYHGQLLSFTAAYYSVSHYNHILCTLTQPLSHYYYIDFSCNNIFYLVISQHLSH